MEAMRQQVRKESVAYAVIQTRAKGGFEPEKVAITDTG